MLEAYQVNGRQRHCRCQQGAELAQGRDQPTECFPGSRWGYRHQYVTDPGDGRGQPVAPADWRSTPAEYRKAITTSALVMGARGNSGVITSQILRGLCEGFAEAGTDEMNTTSLDIAFQKAVEVAFLAVRKAVEGTILTVLRDAAKAAHNAAVSEATTDEALRLIVEEAYASVNRTPDLLPVLKENNVVDAGGFGLAIFFDAFSSAIMGLEQELTDQFKTVRQEPKVEIENINDWEGSHYRYCNEFLVDSDTLDKDEALDFLATMGDCELCVGENPKFKVHVHSNTPNKGARVLPGPRPDL